MTILEVPGVCDTTMSFVLDPVACGAAAVCSAWAAGLANLGKRVHRPHMASDDRGYRLCHYLSIGAVMPRPGNATAGLLEYSLIQLGLRGFLCQSIEVVCPFRLRKKTLRAMCSQFLADRSRTPLGRQAVHLDPSQPQGIRLERVDCPGFDVGIVGKVPGVFALFAAVIPRDMNLGRGATIGEGLTIGPYCAGLVRPSCALVAVSTDGGCWFRLDQFLTHVPHGRDFLLLSRVSPGCLAIVSFCTSKPTKTLAVVCWTAARGLRIARCKHDPTLKPRRGWLIPPLDADSTAQPLLVLH